MAFLRYRELVGFICGLSGHVMSVEKRKWETNIIRLVEDSEVVENAEGEWKVPSYALFHWIIKLPSNDSHF